MNNHNASAPFVLQETSALLLYRLYLILAAVQGIASLALTGWGAVSPGQATGFSAARLALLAINMFGVLGLGWLLIRTWAKPEKFSRAYPSLSACLAGRPAIWAWTFIISILVSISGLFFITLVPEVTEPFTRAYFDRLLPLIIWLTGLAIQTAIAICILRYGRQTLTLYPRHISFYLSIFAIGLIFVFWSSLAQKAAAQEAEIAIWNTLGAPLLETQIIIGWLAGMILLAVMILLPAQTNKKSWLQKLSLQRLDFAIGLLLWLVSIALWQSVPLEPNWFVAQPRLPNVEYYPSSDAQYYDITAQSALIGEGFLYFDQKLYVRRPFLALLIMGLRALGSQDYETSIFVQLFPLALITPLAYFLTKQIHNRISGVMAAVFIMLREANSIALTGRITTSNAKLLMADVPAMLVTLAFVTLAVIWLKNLQEHRLYALLAGGVLGIAILIRPETFLYFLTLLGLTALLYLPRKHFRLWIQGVLLVSLGVSLALAPWIWRNWRMTGQIVLDSPIMRLELIVLRYRPAADSGQGPAVPQPTLRTPPPQQITETAPSPSTAIPTQPETPPATVITPTPKDGASAPPTAVTSPPAEATPPPPSRRFSYQEFLDYFQAETTQFIRKNPGQILKFITVHFTHNQLQSLMIMPTTFRGFDSLTAYLGHRTPETFWEDCCSSLNYIRRLPYWRRWDGSFPSQATIPLLLNSLLIAIGISEAWKRSRWAGFFPLLISTAFFLMNAIFRNSGGRYIVPTDWTSILYFSIGLAKISTSAIESIRGQKIAEDFKLMVEKPLRARTPVSSWIGWAVGIFLVGCLLPIVEFSIPPRYTDEKKSAMVQALENSDLLSGAERAALQGFIDNKGLVYAGRALYPNFYPANVYQPGSRLSPNRAYPRLTYYLVGPNSKAIHLPLRKSPAYFPNAADVLVFLCPDGSALATAVFDENGIARTFALRNPLSSPWLCPLPELHPLDE
jgi:hypothetical protein